MLIRRSATALAASAVLAGLTACGGALGDVYAAGGGAPNAPAAAEKSTQTSSEKTKVKVRKIDGKQVLTDGAGRSLYMFKKDEPNKSNCTGECLKIWPALKGPATASGQADQGELSDIPRAEGGTQVTYAGRPLYHFAKDKKPGDTNGQGVKGVWFLVDPQGEPVGDQTVKLTSIKDTKILTDGAGRSLYMFLKDKPNKSNCNDKICKKTWPVMEGPAKAGAGIKAGDLGKISRPDGTTQATYLGQPLYYHARDKKPGDIRGRGFKGVWCLIAVDGRPAKP